MCYRRAPCRGFGLWRNLGEHARLPHVPFNVEAFGADALIEVKQCECNAIDRPGKGLDRKAEAVPDKAKDLANPCRVLRVVHSRDECERNEERYGHAENENPSKSCAKKKQKKNPTFGTSAQHKGPFNRVPRADLLNNAHGKGKANAQKGEQSVEPKPKDQQNHEATED